MDHRSLPQGERGYELLLEHCAALTRADSARTPAFERLEQARGGRFYLTGSSPPARRTNRKIAPKDRRARTSAVPWLTPIASRPPQMNRPRKNAQRKDVTPG